MDLASPGDQSAAVCLFFYWFIKKSNRHRVLPLPCCCFIIEGGPSPPSPHLRAIRCCFKKIRLVELIFRVSREQWNRSFNKRPVLRLPSSNVFPAFKEQHFGAVRHTEGDAKSSGVQQITVMVLSPLILPGEMQNYFPLLSSSPFSRLPEPLSFINK